MCVIVSTPVMLRLQSRGNPHTIITMRVTLLSKALVVGAYQRKCELIAAHPDVELTVLVPPAWEQTALQRAHTQGYTLRTLPIRLNGNFHLHHYPTLGRELVQAKPDVFHIDEEPYNLATWLALRAAQHLPRQPRTLFFSWQNIQRNYPPPFSLMERAVVDGVDGAIVGNSEAGQVWKHKGFRKPMWVIPQFGVDDQIFVPQENPPPRPFTLGCVGRLRPEKGFALAIEALRGLPDARLIIVGEGPSEPVLRDQALQMGVAAQVAFWPMVPSTEMPALYPQFDVLVLPSLTQPNWKEQFGRVLTEAMACGVPVIGSDSGEIPNVIGDAGLIFPEGDSEALGHQLITLRDQPRLREALGRKGRARVQAHFTMQRVADATVEVYRALLR